jgi:uncharacterized protein (DUF2141 family)
MKVLTRIAFFAALIFGIVSAVSAQQEARQATGSISGRVTISDSPARGVTVMAVKADDEPQRRVRYAEDFSEATLKVKTDAEGHFHFPELAAGTYRVSVYAPTLVGVKANANSAKKATVKKSPTEDKDDDDEEDEEAIKERVTAIERDSPIKMIELREAQTVEDINFSLARGGVITGRVTYADGRPVIGETVYAMRTDRYDSGRYFSLGWGAENFTTDDRGIYRIYGLTDGHYKVAVDAKGLSAFVVLTNRSSLKRTFHPGVTDESLAAVVEINNGNELRGIDIKFGNADKTFVVTGRIIEAETGKPVPDVSVISMKTKGEDGNSESITQANSKGEFRLEGLAPGAYIAYSLDGILRQSEFYGEPNKFEIRDRNLSGVELKMHRGATISGVVALEGANDPEAFAKLIQQTLVAISFDEKRVADKENMNEGAEMLNAMSIAQSPISPDGGFSLKGLKIGKVQMDLGGFLRDSTFAVLRLERGGIEQPNLELRQNENITDLRVIVAQRNCVLRGQVIIDGEALPKQGQIFVSARRIVANQQQNSPNLFGGERGANQTIEANGQFKFTNLTPGEYEVTATAWLGKAADGDDKPPSVTQHVFVTGDKETEVTLVLTVKTKK